MKVNSKQRGRAVAQDPAGVFRACLAEKQLRFTAQRRDVFAEALNRGGHFDADDLYAALRAAGRYVSLATVYRTLGLLRECGLIRQAPRWEDRERYESVYGQQHHDHMLCVECGRVIEFCDDELEALQNRVCRRHGFAPIDHRMGIRGICRSCHARVKAGGG
jgi:Fur family ferric uptake transcriptional regulator